MEINEDKIFFQNSIFYGICKVNMLRQRTKEAEIDDQGKIEIKSNNLFAMKSKLFFIFIFLVMVVIVTVPFITYSNKSKTTALSNDFLHDDKTAPAKKITFSNIPQIFKNRRTRVKQIKDGRSKLDIKVLFIGVKKCGTTTVKAFAGAHPDILVANNPHVCRPVEYNSYKKIERVLAEAKAKNKVALIENNECVHNIRYFDLLKKPEKLVLLLCDPTLRTFSDYKHIIRTFSYKSTFEEIVSNALSLVVSHQNDSNFAEYMSNFRYRGHLDYSIVSVGVYYEYVKEFFKRYKAKDILILSGAELKQKPHEVMHQLEDFLGLPHYLDRSKFVKNTDTGFYCVKLANRQTRCIGLGNTQIFAPPDPSTLEKLKTFYHPYNEKLYKLLNRTFMWI